MAIFAVWLSPGGLAWARSRAKAPKSIPGPPGYPLIGSLTVFMASTPHRVLAKLATAFRAVPLMAFSVGLTRFIISSEAETAKEILNSSAFADRPVKESAYELLFHRAMGFAPYGEYWRNLRRISAAHLFSPRRIAGIGSFRIEVGLKMVEQVKSLMAKNGEVKVKKVLHYASLNNVMMSVFGKRYDFDESNEGLMLEELVSEGYELLGIFNWSDHFPLLGWLDLQGVRKRCRNLVSKVNLFVEKIIQEHRLKRIAGVSDDHKSCAGDFVDVLLDMEKEAKLNDSDIIAVLWVCFILSCCVLRLFVVLCLLFLSFFNYIALICRK